MVFGDLCRIVGGDLVVRWVLCRHHLYQRSFQAVPIPELRFFPGWMVRPELNRRSMREVWGPLLIYTDKSAPPTLRLLQIFVVTLPHYTELGLSSMQVVRRQPNTVAFYPDHLRTACMMPPVILQSFLVVARVF